MSKMKLFDPDLYLNHVITADQAREISDISDDILCKASFVLYGRYVNRKYVNFTCEQKVGDTHVVLSYFPKQMKGAK